jgi:hypothetical protein
MNTAKLQLPEYNKKNEKIDGKTQGSTLNILNKS